MKSKKRLLVLAVIMIVASCSIVYAAKHYEISFTNNFQTGSVDVKIDQYEMTAEGEMRALPGEVMPNQDVSYIPRVTNLRADSYVRVKVDIMMDEETPIPITIDNVYDINDEWVQRGEYFYLTRVLKTNESSDLFRGFHVPAEWTQDTASPFKIKLTVDAVQELNFEPDFDELLPWGTIEIQQAKLEDNINYNEAKGKGAYHGFKYTSYNGLESETGDLFENFDHFMAGDKFEDTLEMKNASDRNVILYFKTETVGSDLINQMRLKITCGDMIVYEGDLASKDLDSWIELTTVGKGDVEDFHFEVYLPESSDNFYTVLKDQVVWKFKCVEIDEPIVQTGDVSNMTLYISAMVIALLAMLLLFATRKGRKDEDID